MEWSDERKMGFYLSPRENEDEEERLQKETFWEGAFKAYQQHVHARTVATDSAQLPSLSFTLVEVQKAMARVRHRCTRVTSFGSLQSVRMARLLTPCHALPVLALSAERSLFRSSRFSAVCCGAGRSVGRTDSTPRARRHHRLVRA